MKGLLIGGDRSGCGKTSITLAIASLLSRKFTVQTFKTGMDYIDPSYLTGVTRRPCRNLDSFVMSPGEIRQIFSHGCKEADFALIEGVRGLFEGAEALSDIGSTASIARALNVPVILVISARSITRSAAAIVRGFQVFAPDIKIGGVILNNVMGPKHAKKAITAIEHYCEVPVLGAIPRMEAMELTMRHLGLVPFIERQGSGEFERRIKAVTGLIGDHVALDRLVSISGDISVDVNQNQVFSPEHEPDVTIAVAHDEAFNFYYSDLFDILPSLGAHVVKFSPVHGTFPKADGYIIGGGYPELFLKELESNARVREGILEESRNNVPVYAECGGLMYLTDSIVLKEGWENHPSDREYTMAGVFTGKTVMPAGRVVSYVEGVSSPASPVGAGVFRGHEFHYSEVVLDRNTRYAYNLSRGTGIEGTLDGALIDQTLGSYTHLHPVPSIGMIRHFVNKCRQRG
ncbi:MAG TPA: Ni-sirohydrochlorin a,c-diamide synthase [Methanoregulaceae archaeon]|nr:Ni-sirohydrochlorin a,c-diamide synthase [Methanoregulaceae archaeon]